MDTLRIGVEIDASDAKTGAKEATKAVDQVGDAAHEAGRDMAGLGRTTKNAAAEIKKASDASQEASVDMRQMARSGDAAETSIKDVSRAAATAVVPLERMDRALAQGTRSIGANATTLRATAKLVRMGSEGIVNRYTTLGVGIAAAAATVASANLDAALRQAARTGHATREQTDALRVSLYQMSKQTGISVDELGAGFSKLIQTMTWDQALESIGAVNTAMRVTNAGAEDLTGALKVAGTSFNIDMAKPGLALQTLDKMTVAADLAGAEMDMLPGVFARMGVNANLAGASFEQTLALAEVLSKLESNPERLGTLGDSMLRLFTNNSYLREAQKSSGVNFFDAKGARRDIADILGDMRSKLKAVRNEDARLKWIGKTMGATDQDTQKAINYMLGGDRLETLRDYQKKISGADNTLNRMLPDIMDDTKPQMDRFKANMREAGENFAQPINTALKNMSRWASDTPGASKTALYTGAGIAGAAGTVVIAAKLIEAWQTVSGLFRSKGAAGGAAALGGATAGGDGVRVFVTNPGFGMGPAGLPLGGAGAGAIGSVPVAAEQAAAQSAARTGVFSRWGSSLVKWAKGAGAGVSQLAQRAGVWAQGGLYTAERMLGRSAAGRWAMNAGQGVMARGTNAWRNLTWGSNTLGVLSRNSLVRAGLWSAAIGLPLEYLNSGVSMRSTAAGLGQAGGTALGWLGGLGLGAATTGGVASYPLAMAGSLGGGWAGREGTLALYDWLAGMKDVQPSATASQQDLKPNFNIAIRIDESGRYTTEVEGPGAHGTRVNTSLLGARWGLAN